MQQHLLIDYIRYASQSHVHPGILIGRSNCRDAIGLVVAVQDELFWVLWSFRTPSSSLYSSTIHPTELLVICQ